MGRRHHFLWPALALAFLAGCATAPREPAVAANHVAVAVSCKTDALTDQPCIAMAQQTCPDAAVDTIRMVFAKLGTEKDHPATTYDYRATYSCHAPAGRAKAP